MTEQNKQLLLKDLCARLPYGVKCEIIRDFWGGWERMSLKPGTEILNGKTYHLFATNTTFGATDEGVISVIPYLRPMSSMTEEEKKELKEEHKKDEKVYAEILEKISKGDESARGTAIPHFAADWCNAHYFDYRGLIPMGLALEAPEGMYKIK